MERNVLFTASTYGHIRAFHLPALRALAARGWRVTAGCADAPASVPGAARTLDLPFRKRMGAPENFRAAAALRREVRSRPYALVITHTSLAAFFTRLALRGLRERPRVVNVVHGYLFDDASPPVKRAVLLSAERLTAPVTDLVLTMNAYDDALARRYALGRTVIRIPGVGADFSRLDGPPLSRAALRRERGIPEDAFVAVYPAEFSRRKSQEVLIRALARLPERAVLVLPGDGALRERCAGLARRLGLSDRVILPGFAAEMRPWYALADAAAPASRSEGLPWNVLEAMYLGLPVAASAVKGHTDLIAQGETGLLYPYGDADACADRLRFLLERPEAGQRMAERARAQAEAYRLERVLPEVLACYEGAAAPAYRTDAAAGSPPAVRR